MVSREVVPIVELTFKLIRMSEHSQINMSGPNSKPSPFLKLPSLLCLHNTDVAIPVYVRRKHCDSCTSFGIPFKDNHVLNMSSMSSLR